MSDVSDLFPSEYLSAKDLSPGGDTVLVTYAERGQETNIKTGKEYTTVILKFDKWGDAKKLPCNKTQWETMCTLFGAVTERWVNQYVHLTSMPTSLGPDKPTIAITLPMTQAPTQQPPQPPEPQAPPQG